MQTIRLDWWRPIQSKKSGFLLELNEMPNECGQFATAFVRHFLNTVLLNRFSQNFIQLYGQRAIFRWFVCKQNAFYGQCRYFHRFVRKRQWFCQIKHLINQRTNNLPPASFRSFPSLQALVTYTQKNRIRAIRFFNLKHSVFSAFFQLMMIFNDSIFFIILSY